MALKNWKTGVASEAWHGRISIRDATHVDDAVRHLAYVLDDDHGGFDDGYDILARHLSPDAFAVLKKYRDNCRANLRQLREDVVRDALDGDST